MFEKRHFPKILLILSLVVSQSLVLDHVHSSEHLHEEEIHACPIFLNSDSDLVVHQTAAIDNRPQWSVIPSNIELHPKSTQYSSLKARAPPGSPLFA